MLKIIQTCISVALALSACQKAHVASSTTVANVAKKRVSLMDRLTKILTDNGVNTSSAETGATMLHYAAANNEISTLNFLLSVNKDIDVNLTTNQNKNSPLHAAALFCADEAAAVLLGHNATDADLQAADGQTAYQIAVTKNCKNPEAFKR